MANVALEALLQATAQGADRPPRRDVAEQVAALPDRGPRRHRRARGPRRQALRHRPGRQRRPPPVDEGARGGRRRRLERSSWSALGQPQARAQALLAGQIDATTMGIGSFTAIDDDPNVAVLVDVDAYYRAAPVLSKLNIVRSDTLADRGAEVEAVIEAITLASRDFAAHPDRWVAAMRKARPDVPEPDLVMLAEAFAGSLERRRRPHRPELEAAQAWLHEGEDFEGRRAGAARRLGRPRAAARRCWRRSGRSRKATCRRVERRPAPVALRGLARARRQGGARRHRPRRPARRGRRAARPLGLRQDLAVAADRRAAAPRPGGVRIDGAAPVPGRAAAMVFQSYRLLPWKTVRGNVAFALPHPRWPSARRGSPACSASSASPASPRPGRASFPAACSSGWRSPGRWRSSRGSC